ncbi:putative carboxy-cis,cis-muconate cyclase [Coleophoma crateriformis]|uniref:Putative carboxy-cis,cis-muconate cyclase n=1 Tax=Coleophoma crateriformis TaxID=565419 RepID=A0A3D8T0M0_9HELO|nr:putative carboxy-cis,cis-muconate cyclase [Coleophoma crateriformis]
MLSFTPTLLLGLCAGQALGAVHHMFSGVFSGTDIYAIEFDDEANTLTAANNITSIASSSKWIAIDALKKNLYVANGAQYDSYTITNSTGLEYVSSVSVDSSCSNLNFIVASSVSPYVVFGAPYSTGCAGNMLTVDSTGALSTIVGNMTYGSGSGVHGLALSADNEFVYSADDMGNAVWVHSYDTTTNEVTEVQYLAAPTGADPRHMAIDPRGAYAYVLFEASSEIGVYARDNSTGMLTYTNTTYPLLPTGFTNATSSYWADEVVFSYSADGTPKYMYAATRSRTTTIPGYVSAFSLDSNTGAIIDQLFLTETTGSGGSANSVTAALFSEEYFAITDSGSNFIEMWKITVNGTSSATASAVAHFAMDSGPSTVVMYD